MEKYIEKYIENKFLRLILLFVIGVFLQFNNIVIAQEVSRPGTQISDNTAPHSLDPLAFSILDLNSAEKGFLMPRMTTAERMRIPTQELVGGMAIYNTTIDCIEFYNTTRQKWMSTCGDVEPAIFTIPDDKCSSIIPSGEYAEKVFLDSRKNLIAIEVNVSAAGTYNIEAIAYDNDEKLNGYSFVAQGVFPSEGNFTVILKGHGTPKKGYPRNVDGTPTAKDTIVFSFNNKVISCKVSNIVDTKAITYDLVEVIQSGDFFTKVNVVDPKTTGKITVKINNISQAGIVEIKTATQNGISFSGRKVLNQSEVNSRTATIDLIASGVPSTPAKLPFDFVSNSYVRHEDGEPAKKITKIVAISPVNVTSDCKGAIFGKEFKVNEALTSEHIITVPVKVTATGRGRVIGTIATGNGQTELIEYASETLDFVFNAANTDVMNVELKPVSGTGKPKVGGRNLVMKLQLESKGLKEYLPSEIDEKILKDICSLDVPVKSSWADINYNSISTSFTSTIKAVYNDGKQYIPARLKMSDSGDVRFRITVSNIYVNTPGKYEFETDLFNGVQFKASGNFDNVGYQSVTLMAYGMSETDRPTEALQIYYRGENGRVSLGSGHNRTAEVDYVYRAMTVYSIGGGESWHPGGRRDPWGFSSVPIMLRSEDHFGWNGVVRIDRLSYYGIPYGSNAANNTAKDMEGNASSFNIGMNNSDIIFIGTNTTSGSVTKSSQSFSNLAIGLMYLNKAVVYSESNSTYLSEFMGLMGAPGLSISSANVSGPHYIAQSNSLNSLIVGDPFKNFGLRYSNIGLSGRAVIGSDRDKNLTINSLPSTFSPIASGSSGGRSNVLAFMHNEYGLVVIGNNNIMGGYDNRLGSAGWTASSDRQGTPVTATIGGVTTYNSWFLLNLMHWAIDYSQKKVPIK